MTASQRSQPARRSNNREEDGQERWPKQLAHVLTAGEGAQQQGHGKQAGSSE